MQHHKEYISLTQHSQNDRPVKQNLVVLSNEFTVRAGSETQSTGLPTISSNRMLLGERQSEVLIQNNSQRSLENTAKTVNLKTLQLTPSRLEVGEAEIGFQ